MKTLRNRLLAGLALGVFGFALDAFEVPGFCYRSGYRHLNFLSSLFYALGDPQQTRIIVFVCNFFIGALIALVIEVFQLGQRHG